jgi:hypothetical protein
MAQPRDRGLPFSLQPERVALLIRVQPPRARAFPSNMAAFEAELDSFRRPMSKAAERASAAPVL